MDGFLREDADLLLVAVGDGPADGDAETATERLDEISSSWRLSGLVPLDGACAARALEYEQIIESSGGTAEDLCDDHWSDAFAAFAELPTSGDPVSYALAVAPVVSTVNVAVEGVTWTAWTWDEASNAVVFDDPEDVPALGAEVVVSYVSAVACG